MMSPRFGFSYGSMYLEIGPRRRVSQLIDQQVIADEQRILHGPGGNHERLHQCGGAEEQQDNGDGPLGDKAARRIAFGGRRRGRRGRGLNVRYGRCFLWFHRHLL